MGNVKAQVFEVLKTMASAYGKDSITQARLQIYTEVLTQKLTPNELKGSLSRVLETCEYFPSISKIIELTKGSAHDNAIDASARIVKAITDFGFYQSKEAMKELEDIWHIVEGVGGWKYLCSLTNDELGILRAQMRDIAKARISKSAVCAPKSIDSKGDTSTMIDLKAQKENTLVRVDFQNNLRSTEDLSIRRDSKAVRLISQINCGGDTL